MGAAPGRTLALAVDVSDPDSVEAAARRVESAFGPLHVAVNNAGVAMHGTPLEKITLADWQWVIGVNIHGVINGIRSFVPRIRAHGEGGHVVNTASVVGLVALPGLGIYAATMFAVLAISETLREELAPEGIGVSVLCPGGVRTRIHEAARNRPAALGGPAAAADRRDATDAAVETGMDPDRVGACVVRVVRRNDLYVLTHPEFRAPFAARTQAILDAFDRAAAEPA